MNLYIIISAVAVTLKKIQQLHSWSFRKKNLFTLSVNLFLLQTVKSQRQIFASLEAILITNGNSRKLKTIIVFHFKIHWGFSFKEISSSNPNLCYEENCGCWNCNCPKYSAKKNILSKGIYSCQKTQAYFKIAIKRSGHAFSTLNSLSNFDVPVKNMSDSM